MISVFPLHQILEAYPATKNADGSEYLPLEFLARLGRAIRTGELSLYTKNLCLLSSTTTLSLDIYLSRDEVNNWFNQQHMPYQWHPVSSKNTPLKDRKYELKKEAIAVADNLRAKGNRESYITKETVSRGIVERQAFGDYAADTIGRCITAAWWKKS